MPTPRTSVGSRDRTGIRGEEAIRPPSLSCLLLLRGRGRVGGFVQRSGGGQAVSRPSTSPRPPGPDRVFSNVSKGRTTDERPAAGALNANASSLVKNTYVSSRFAFASGFRRADVYPPLAGRFAGRAGELTPVYRVSG